jgi:DNA-binding Xre family transcriptional regulator
MIIYDKLWQTLREKDISQYSLIHKYKISTGQLDRLRKNENVSTHTLNLLCGILKCSLSDIAEYIETQNDADTVNTLTTEK